MTSQIFLMLLTITGTSFLVFLFMKLHDKKRVEAKRVPPPPGPNKLPIIGNLHQLNGDSPYVSLQQLSNVYGPLMFLQLGSVPTLVISSADVARDIFRTNDLILSGRPRLYAAKKFSYNLNDIAFASYGEYWREVRKIAIVELLSSKRVQSFQAVRDEEVMRMLEFIAQSSTEPIDLSRLTLMLSNNIVCRVVFGEKLDRGEDNSNDNNNGRIKCRFDAELMHKALAFLGKNNIADFLPWMGWLNMFNGVKAGVDKTFRELDKLYEEEIQLHLDPTRPKPEHEDIVDVLLRIQKDNDSTLTREQIKGVLTDLFIAGVKNNDLGLSLHKPSNLPREAQYCAIVSLVEDTFKVNNNWLTNEENAAAWAYEDITISRHIAAWALCKQRPGKCSSMGTICSKRLEPLD